MISTQSELQGQESCVSLGFEAKGLSGSHAELLPRGQAGVLQTKAPLRAIRQGNELAGRRGKGSRWGQAEAAAPWHREGEVTSAVRPQRQLTPARDKRHRAGEHRLLML